jgi:hypothetical protein
LSGDFRKSQDRPESGSGKTSEIYPKRQRFKQNSGHLGGFHWNLSGICRIRPQIFRKFSKLTSGDFWKITNQIFIFRRKRRKLKHWRCASVRIRGPPNSIRLPQYPFPAYSSCLPDTVRRYILRLCNVCMQSCCLSLVIEKECCQRGCIRNHPISASIYGLTLVLVGPKRRLGLGGRNGLVSHGQAEHDLNPLAGIHRCLRGLLWPLDLSGPQITRATFTCRTAPCSSVLALSVQ